MRALPLLAAIPSHSRSLLYRTVDSLRAVAFWSAVALPLAYVPLLTTDLVPATLVVAGLLAHLACLLAGHTYGRLDLGPTESGV